jgi:alkylation response protein AidB-like acyl-CoA dehydrogenase
MQTDTEFDYENFREEAFQIFWEELSPLEKRIETEERIPNDEVFPILRRAGAFAMLIPREYGGLGLSVSQYVPLIAELAKVHGGIRALVHVHNSFAHAIALLGDEQQRRDLLPPAARGEASIAFGLTEPDSGSGVDTGTVADRDGDDFLITGRKWLITNSDFASHFIILARTGQAAGRPVLSSLLVPRDAPGLTIIGLPETMGCKGGQHGMITLDGVRVSQQALLGGREGAGEQQLEKTLDLSRLLVAASSLGTAERALELSVAHARARVTFGKPLSERQAIQRYLGEMATDVNALRLMIDDAARRADAQLPITAEASMCKLMGIDVVGRVTDRALLVQGGIGYTRAGSLERLYRDARLNWLEEGPPTVHYLTIARTMIEQAEDQPTVSGLGRDWLATVTVAEPGAIG